MDIKLTLIVPIYGVEKYIDKFLDSLEQNLTSDIEVILVDDGTKDNSGKIADQFAALHPEYIKVVHKENGGASSARNKGLEIAQGEYVIFPDPDDYLHSNYVKEILSAIEKYNKPDIVFFDYYIGTCEEDLKKNTVPGFKEGFISKEKFFYEHIKDDSIKGMMWCKAIKKSFYDGLSFNVNTRVAEDYELMTDLALKLESIVYIPKPLYYYIMRESSLTHNTNIEDYLKMYDLVLDRYQKHSKVFKDIGNVHLLKAAHNILIYAYTKRINNIEIKKFEKLIQENIYNIFLYKEFSINQKKQCFFIYLGFAERYYNWKYKK